MRATRAHYIVFLVMALGLARCPNSAAVRVVSPSLDDVLRGMGASSRQVDQAVVYAGDELAQLRQATGATEDAIRSTAPEVGRTTTLPTRVQQTLASVPKEDAITVINMACDAYDATHTITPPDRHIEEVIDEVIGLFQQETSLPGILARDALCRGAKLIDATQGL